ncbi:hypothetical protein GPALN_006125 [Globodera pallida]|nr:hypothetical protein GPALN_006125 [Globodera pallida]
MKCAIVLEHMERFPLLGDADLAADGKSHPSFVYIASSSAGGDCIWSADAFHGTDIYPRALWKGVFVPIQDVLLKQYTHRTITDVHLQQPVHYLFPSLEGWTNEKRKCFMIYTENGMAHCATTIGKSATQQLRTANNCPIVFVL